MADGSAHADGRQRIDLAAGRRRDLGVSEADAERGAEEHRPSRRPTAAVRWRHRRRRGAIGKQIALAFLDPVLHVVAGAVDLLVEKAAVRIGPAQRGWLIPLSQVTRSRFSGLLRPAAAIADGQRQDQRWVRVSARSSILSGPPNFRRPIVAVTWDNGISHQRGHIKRGLVSRSHPSPFATTRVCTTRCLSLSACKGRPKTLITPLFSDTGIGTIFRSVAE